MTSLDAEQLDGQRRLARDPSCSGRRSAGTRSSGWYSSPIRRHVAEHVRVAGVVEPEAVLELDDEADRLAEVERRLRRRRSSRRPSGRRRTIVTLIPAASTVPPLFIPIDGVVAAGQLPAEPQAHLVDARPGRPQPAGERDARRPGGRRGRGSRAARRTRSTESAGLRAPRVAEPRVEEDRPAARRRDLDSRHGRTR